ncbi:hypothetical protein L7F22_036219 [Adiantum nelumboides]|nr:hypothetical protein [Adiantum nelumboides]
MEGECCLSFRIVDVHLSSTPTQQTHLWTGNDDEEAADAAAGGEVLQGTLLQMSQLGLPTSFSSASHRLCSNKTRRHKKSRCRDHATHSLDAVSTSVDSIQDCTKGSDEDVSVRVINGRVNHSADADTLASCSVDDAPARVCNEQANYSAGADSLASCSVEVVPVRVSNNQADDTNGFVEDVPVRVSSDEANQSAGADTLAPLPVAYSKASTLICQWPMRMYQRVCNFISELGALLLKRESTSWIIGEMPDVCMAASAAGMTTNDLNVSYDQGQLFQMDASTILNGRASSVDEGYAPFEDVNIPEIDSVAFADSANDEELGERVDNLPVKDSGLTNNAKGSQLSEVGCSRWSACWDAYYGRYYFYNGETQESTWEPPIGFETYGVATVFQDTTKDHSANGALADFEVDETELSTANDSKLHDLQHQASHAEFVSRILNDDGTAEGVQNDGGLQTVSNNAPLLVDDSEMFVKHGEIALDDGSFLHLVETGAINGSASCPQTALKVDNVKVKVTQPSMQETYRKNSEPASLENRHWSVCWDDYYGRYYFQNTDTLESTWEPPEGFETYAYNKSYDLSTVASENKVIFTEESKTETTSEDSSKMGSLQVVEIESEVFFSEDSKAELILKDSSKLGTLIPAVGIVSSLKDSKDQEASSIKEVEKAFLLEFPCSPCHEVSTETTDDNIAHLESSKRKVAVLKKRTRKAAQYYLRTENQHADAAASSPTISKYWFQRFHLFSKYELGVQLDEEGWFSVTPEAIAKHQAGRCKGGLIIDAFTGVGGNAIQFALAGYHVVAIENDPKRIEYAHHNAKIYGVANRIDFVLGDFFCVSSSMQADVVFLSPPWGGPDYLNAAVYDILTMLQPKDGATLLRVAHSIAPNIMLFLPRNVDMDQLAEVSKRLWSPCICEVERNFLNGKLKAITAYFGQFARTMDCSK